MNADVVSLGWGLFLIGVITAFIGLFLKGGDKKVDKWLKDPIPDDVDGEADRTSSPKYATVNVAVTDQAGNKIRGALVYSPSRIVRKWELKGTTDDEGFTSFSLRVGRRWIKVVPPAGSGLGEWKEKHDIYEGKNNIHVILPGVLGKAYKISIDAPDKVSVGKEYTVRADLSDARGKIVNKYIEFSSESDIVFTPSKANIDPKLKYAEAKFKSDTPGVKKIIAKSENAKAEKEVAFSKLIEHFGVHKLNDKKASDKFSDSDTLVFMLILNDKVPDGEKARLAVLENNANLSYGGDMLYLDKHNGFYYYSYPINGMSFPPGDYTATVEVLGEKESIRFTVSGTGSSGANFNCTVSPTLAKTYIDVKAESSDSLDKVYIRIRDANGNYYRYNNENSNYHILNSNDNLKWSDHLLLSDLKDNANNPLSSSGKYVVEFYGKKGSDLLKEDVEFEVAGVGQLSISRYRINHTDDQESYVWYDSKSFEDFLIVFDKAVKDTKIIFKGSRDIVRHDFNHKGTVASLNDLKPLPIDLYDIYVEARSLAGDVYSDYLKKGNKNVKLKILPSGSYSGTSGSGGSSGGPSSGPSSLGPGGWSSSRLNSGSSTKAGGGSVSRGNKGDLYVERYVINGIVNSDIKSSVTGLKSLDITFNMDVEDVFVELLNSRNISVRLDVNVIGNQIKLKNIPYLQAGTYWIRVYARSSDGLYEYDNPLENASGRPLTIAIGSNSMAVSDSSAKTISPGGESTATSGVGAVTETGNKDNNIYQLLNSLSQDTETLLRALDNVFGVDLENKRKSLQKLLDEIGGLNEEDLSNDNLKKVFDYKKKSHIILQRLLSEIKAHIKKEYSDLKNYNEYDTIIHFNEKISEIKGQIKAISKLQGLPEIDLGRIDALLDKMLDSMRYIIDIYKNRGFFGKKNKLIELEEKTEKDIEDILNRKRIKAQDEYRNVLNSITPFMKMMEEINKRVIYLKGLRTQLDNEIKALNSIIK